jgi:hypothetical protein
VRANLRAKLWEVCKDHSAVRVSLRHFDELSSNYTSLLKSVPVLVVSTMKRIYLQSNARRLARGIALRPVVEIALSSFMRTLMPSVWAHTFLHTCSLQMTTVDGADYYKNLNMVVVQS